jgi:hypothetical protein
MVTTFLSDRINIIEQAFKWNNFEKKMREALFAVLCG